MTIKKIVSVCIFLTALVLNCREAKSQIINKITYYKFDDPYFMGKGLSDFLYRYVTLIKHDFDVGFDGKSVFVFTLTKNNEIKNLHVTDSTINKSVNRQFYDAIADHPKSWQVAFLNNKPVDVTIRVTAKLSDIVNMSAGYYSIIGDYEYLIDNQFSNNFYDEGVKYSSENNFSEAIKYFDQVIALSANEVDALYSRGICKYKSDDKAGACEDWKKIQSIGKPDADKLILKYCDQ
jgi:tetratricopeptide (TPR) repeat protein